MSPHPDTIPRGTAEYHAMASDSPDSDTMGPEKMQSPCHFMKLFDGYDPHGTLWKVRNKIYSYVWSRDRRDKAKFDWVLSQYGVNRNVPERFIRDTPYQTAAFTSIDKLPCWLMLANKKISAEFTAYIYSLNFLEIDVDLKGMHTMDNETNLHRIITRLQNQNFVRYTQTVRVRIHFPDNYPFQDLPSFNQHALEDIATSLDTFKNLKYMDVRIVPMQDPRDYELRLAAFPFYQMDFTDWSIHILSDTLSDWDLVDGEQIHHLNKAWSLYQATGSLTEPVNLGVTKNKSVAEAEIPAQGIVSYTKNHTSAQRKNGSQKRRNRKVRATISATTGNGPAYAIASVAASSLPGTLASTSRTEPPEIITPSQPVATKLEPMEEPVGERPAPEPSIASVDGPPQTPSLSASPSKHSRADLSTDTSTSNTSGEIVLTPDMSSVASPASDNIPMAQVATELGNTADSNESMYTQLSRTPCSLSPAPSSATLGRGQDEAECLPATGKTLNATALSANKGDCENMPQKKKKKRRNRKKPRKHKDVGTTAHLVEGVDEQPVAASVPVDEDEVDIGRDQELSCDENPTLIDGHMQSHNDNMNVMLFKFGKPDIPLSEFSDLQPISTNVCVGTKADGCKLMMPRTWYTERLFRQQQRATASQLEKEAEKTKTREKRQSKKAKEALLRRREPSHNLREQVNNTKQPNIGNRSSGPEAQLDISDNSDDGVHAYDYKSDLSSETTDLDMDIRSCVGDYGGSDENDDDGETRALFSNPSHEHSPTPSVVDADMTVLGHDSCTSTCSKDRSQGVSDEEMGPENEPSAQYVHVPLTDEDCHQKRQVKE